MPRSANLLALAGGLALLGLAGDAAAAGKHAMAEMTFLIGTWDCRVTQAGRPELKVEVVYDWMYETKRVLKETVKSAQGSAVFQTAYDARSDTFKGVTIGPFGRAVVWENSGEQPDGTSTEVGYVFGDGRLTPVSRTDWQKLSETHYVIRDFGPDVGGAHGPAQDTEDCLKRP
jgi:hypothetical protein